MIDIVERLPTHLKDYAAAVEAADEIQQLRDYLVQIRNVCRDSAPEGCKQRMALAFVFKIADAALSPRDRGGE